LVAQNVAVRKVVNVEGPRIVEFACLVPFEAANTDLESVHALTVVLDLLVAVLTLIIVVVCAVKADIKSTEFSVEGDKVCLLDCLEDVGKLLDKIGVNYFHFDRLLNLII